MGYFTNYTITAECLLQFFYLVRQDQSLPGHGLPDPREFPPQLRVHSYRINYDDLASAGIGYWPSTLSESGAVTSAEDPRFGAILTLRRTSDQMVEAEIELQITGKAGRSQTFLVPPDTTVPFMVNLYGPPGDNTALVLHGVFKGWHRNTLLDRVGIFVGPRRGP